MATDEEVKKQTDEEVDEADEAESDDESRPRSESEDDIPEAEFEEKSSSEDEEAEEKPAKAKSGKAAKAKAPEESEEEKEEEEEGEEPAVAAKAEAGEEEEGEAAPMPTQLGYRRFVYAAYLAGGIAIAFILDKVIGYAWYKLHDWKPDALPEPQDEISVPIAAILAIGITLYYWNRTRARALAEEVAEELTKVTWPTRQEVTNSTTVVVITTVFATVFFALMDQFWLWVTKHVYGS